MKKLYFAFLLLLLSLFYSEVTAQTGLARFTSPANNATGVSRTPTLTIVTANPIDSSSIQWTKPDSVDNEYDSYPTILLIPKSVFDNFSDSVWHFFAIHGSGLIVNDTTLEFTPTKLDYEKSYVAIIKHLKIIDAGDTLLVSDTIDVAFTTVAPPHNITEVSLFEKSVCFCRDTFSVSFNRSLDSANTPSGQILEIVKRTFSGVSSTSDSMISLLDVGYNTISAATWLKPGDSKTVMVRPTSSLNIDSTYYIRINTSRLNGDTLTDRKYPLTFKSQYRINVFAKPEILTDTLPSGFKIEPSIGSHVVDAGDTIRMYAQDIIGNFRFKKWLCPEDLSVNNNTNATLTILRTCENFKNLTLTAIYERIPFDSLTVITDSCGKVIVSRPQSEIVYYGYPQGYKVQRGSYAILSAQPYCDSVIFDEWESSDTVIDGSKSPILMVNLKNDVTLRAKFAGMPLASENKFHGYGILVPDNIVLPNAIGTVNPIPDQWNTGPVSLVKTITLTILDECYGLQAMIHDDGVGDEVHVPDPLDLAPTYQKQSTKATKPDPAVVYFFVEKLKKNLTIDVVMEDESKPFGPPITFGPVNRKDMWVFVSKKGKYVSAHAWKGIPGEKYHQETYKYPCGENIQLSAETILDDGYEFVRWESGSPYTVSGGDPTLSFDMDQDHRVRAVFKKKFMLLRIGMFQDYYDPAGNDFYESPDFKLCDVDKWGSFMSPYNKDDAGNPGVDPEHQEVYFTSGGGKQFFINLYFNHPVDPNSLRISNTLSTINLMDRSDRIDERPDLYYKFDFNRNATFEGTEQKVVRLEINANNPEEAKRLLKAQQFQIIVEGGLKSTSGATLSNPGYFTATTQYPDVVWELEKIRTGFDGDSWPRGEGEIISWYSAYRQVPTQRFTNTDPQIKDTFNVRLPASGSVEMDDDEDHNYNSKAWGDAGTKRVWRQDDVALSINTIEEDGCSVCSLIPTILDSVASYLSKRKNAPDSAGSGVSDSTSSDVISTVIEIASVILGTATTGFFEDIVGAGDEFMGSGRWVASKTELWGRSSSFKKELQNGNVTYTLKVILK